MAKKAAQVAPGGEGAAQPAGAGKPSEALEAARKERAEKAANERFVFVAEPNAKIPPQAQAIVNIVKAAGDKGLTRAELVKAMEGVVVTRQPQSRILTYYQKKLVEVGSVKIG